VVRVANGLGEMGAGIILQPAGQIRRTTDGNGNSVQYRYNSLGKVSERTDQLGYRETFQYDEEDNLTLHTDRDDGQVQRIYNVFDSIGRLLRAVRGGIPMNMSMMQTET